MNATHLKPGTRIEIRGFDMDWNETWSRATIARPRRENLPLPGMGWHVVKYASGGKMCVHRDRFRVVDNRA